MCFTRAARPRPPRSSRSFCDLPLLCLRSHAPHNPVVRLFGLVDLFYSPPPLPQKKNTTAKTVEGTFRLSYGGTPMGLLSGEDYLAGGRQMEQFGFAKVFGADKEEMVTFLNKNSKHHIPNYNSLVSCAQSTGCPYAWKTDPELKGKNTTVVSVRLCGRAGRKRARVGGRAGSHHDGAKPLSFRPQARPFHVSLSSLLHPTGHYNAAWLVDRPLPRPRHGLLVPRAD